MDRLIRHVRALCRKYSASAAAQDPLRRVFILRGDLIEVRFPNGRKQIVRFRHHDGRYTLESTVLSASRVAALGIGETLRLAYTKNRETDVVAFTLDKSERLIGYVQHVRLTLDTEELEFSILRLAEECDGLEYLLSGGDAN